jgi:hypothetical protein
MIAEEYGISKKEEKSGESSKRQAFIKVNAPKDSF